MNPSQLDDKTEAKETQATQESRTGKKPRHPRRGFGLWLDDLRCRLTVRSWRRKTKKEHKRGRLSARIRKIPYASEIGDSLYTFGFLIEYSVICAGRGVAKAAQAILQHAGSLLLTILRPFLLGIITLCEDLAEPFLRMGSGLRHIRELPEIYPQESVRQLRKEKLRYFARGTKKYFPLVLNALGYLLPVAAAAAFLMVVHTGLNLQFTLNVQVNGQTVGYVESEQVFESASEDVTSRINNAKAVMEAAGDQVPDTQWEVTPTYTLAISDRTMTESEVANAILRTASDEIGEGTAVYIDGTLRFVTEEGDHLRSYLESIKAPYQAEADPDTRVDFVHDIRLVDGVYLLSSIIPYDTVVSTLGEGGGPQIYTAAEGDTVQTAMDSAQVDINTIAALNPDLQSADQELTSGEEVITGVSSPELLKVKVVQRKSRLEDIPYDTEITDSDEYDFGETVTVQEGQLGLQEIVEDYTYVDGVNTQTDVVSVNVVQNPVTELVVRGTKLQNGMVASTGSGTFMWPVPGYTYVSRWMSSYHKGADICASYGTPIYASDSGVIKTATYHYSYGNYIIIDHGNGYQTLYAHMSGFASDIAVGTPVTQGQVIGYVGSTGDSTGNHCHFEMYYNGVRFSARDLFPTM